MVECKQCGNCCKYVAVEIDEPTCREDYNNVIWYLLHENIRIFEQEGDWFIEFITPCKRLDSNNRCTMHNERPKICREHDPKYCENNSEGKFDLMFNTVDEFLNYLKKKKIDFKFKN